MSPINTVLLSYGMSGKLFHAPFIHAHPGFKLMGSWERSTKNIEADYPGVQSFPTLEAVLDNPEVELVIVNTPNNSHFDYAKKAMLAGKHVIVEKAFTTTVAEAEALKAIAEKQNVKLSVFQSRRYDSDFRTVKKVIDDGLLGDINDVSLHYDRFKPAPGPKQHKESPGPGSGLLNDLGPHLSDQAIVLFGMPESIFADIRITRPLAQVDDEFTLLLYYATFRVTLKASVMVRELTPSFIINGRKGSFIKTRADVQEADLLAGKIPSDNNWGVEPVSEQGLLHTEKDGAIVREKIPSLTGSYYEYYDAVFNALRHDKAIPVTADDGINVMRILEAATESNKLGKLVRL